MALLLIGAPLMVAVSMVLQQRALDDLQRQAEQAQVLVQEQAVSVRDSQILLQAFAQQSGTRLTLLQQRPDQILQVDTGGPPDDEVFFDVQDDVVAAATGQVGRVRVDGLLAVTVPVRGSVAGQQLMRAGQNDRALQAEIRAAWVGIAVAGVVALLVAGALAWRQGQRLASPVEQLAVSARALGDGDFSTRAPRSGVLETDQVAAALDATAARLGSLVERSRAFGADASHQLRTPLTALRLQLDALEASAEPAARHDALAAAQTEVDRLDATIDELLSLTEPTAHAESIDLNALVADRVEASQPLARKAGRTIVLQAATVPAVRVRPAAVSQSLQVLLDNALRHGTGVVTVTIGQITGGVRICVADEGQGLPEDLTTAQRSTGPSGRGLPLARALIEGEGGRLVFEPRVPQAMVCFLLPRTEAPERLTAPPAPNEEDPNLAPQRPGERGRP